MRTKTIDEVLTTDNLKNNNRKNPAMSSSYVCQKVLINNPIHIHIATNKALNSRSQFLSPRATYALP